MEIDKSRDYLERSNFSRVIRQQKTQELDLSRDNVSVWISRIPRSKHIPRSGTGK